MALRELVPLSLYSMLASNRGSLFLVYFPIYLVATKGASAPEALALLSVAYVAASLFGPLAGRWSDRVGRRKPFLLAGELIALPLFAMIPALPGVALAGAAFVGANIALSLGSPALTAYVSDVSRDSERGSGYAILNAAGNAGGIVGFVVVAVLSLRFGWEALFPFVVGVMVGTILVVAFLVPEVPLRPSPERRPWREYRPVTIFAVAVSIRGLGMGAIATFYGYYAVQLGAATWEVGLLAIVGLITGAVSSIPLGRLTDRRGEISSILYGTAITVGSLAVFLVASSWAVLIPGQVLRMIGISLLSPAMLSFASRLAPVGHRAEFLGVFSLVNSTFWSIGPLLGGIALGLYGPRGVFGFAIATTVLSLLVVEGLYFRRQFGSTSGAPSARATPASTEGRSAPEPAS